MIHVQSMVFQFYGLKEAEFIMPLLKFFLNHKCFRIKWNGILHILKKRTSLSIGKYVATAVANLYRHSLVHPVIDEHKCCIRHYRYIDDALSLLVGNEQELEAFIKDLNFSMFPLRWTHEVSTVSQHFLGINIHNAQIGPGLYANSIGNLASGHIICRPSAAIQWLTNAAFSSANRCAHSCVARGPLLLICALGVLWNSFPDEGTRSRQGQCMMQSTGRGF